MSTDTKKNLEIAALLLSLILAAVGAMKAWALTPYRLDELAGAQAATNARVESVKADQYAMNSAIREQLATISESQRSFRRDIDEMKGDLKDIKAKK